MEQNSSKDLNISGYKIINLANPQDQQDAATKAYVDYIIWRVHDYTPLSNRAEYIHTINKKQTTMMNLGGLCTVTTNFKLRHGTHTYDYADLAHIWLESVICSNRVWLQGQNLKNKYIQVEYKFPVIVKNWHLLVRYLDYKWTPVTYHWQVSDDGEHWNTFQTVLNVHCGIQHYNGNTHSLLFTNDYTPPNGYHYWRICVVEGSIPKENDNQPWVNLLLMHLE